MKKIFTITIITLCISLLYLKATNVSGGIYANTTWTFANSPYIVTDTVVVFPGVTLTIQPGVVVKFYDNQLLEIRQATLIAQGTSVDSITFTSNSNTPSPGIWGGVLFTSTSISSVVAKLSYCNIFYAEGNGGSSNAHDTTIVTNSIMNYNSNVGMAAYSNAIVDSCIFKFDGTGLIAIGNITNCYFSNDSIGLVSGGIVTNCISRLNQMGINSNWGGTLTNCKSDNNSGLGIFINNISLVQNCLVDSNGTGIDFREDMAESHITSCEIKYNGTGITDSTNSNTGSGDTIKMCQIENNYIGLKIYFPANLISCNMICNNILYDLYDKVSISNSNWSMPDNYWCSNDSATIETFIYDGYDNINLGLVYFMPIDTIGCYLTSGINSQSLNNLQINLYPNPTSGTVTLSYSLPQSGISNYELGIMDVLGRTVYHQPITNSTQSTINLTQLSNGVYFYQLTNYKETYRGKFVIEK